MKRKSLWFTLLSLTLLISIVGCTNSNPTPADYSTPKAAITTFFNSLEAGSVDAQLECWSERSIRERTPEDMEDMEWITEHTTFKVLSLKTKVLSQDSNKATVEVTCKMYITSDIEGEEGEEVTQSMVYDLILEKGKWVIDVWHPN